MAASTCASSVVGACTNLTPRWYTDAEKPPRREARAQVVDGRERLGVLAVADEEQIRRDACLLQRGQQRRRVEVGDARLTHHRDPTAIAEERTGVGQRTGADDHVVRR